MIILIAAIVIYFVYIMIDNIDKKQRLYQKELRYLNELKNELVIIKVNKNLTKSEHEHCCMLNLTGDEYIENYIVKPLNEQIREQESVIKRMGY